MGVTWVCADVSYFAAFDARPPRSPRHRKPPRLVRAGRLTAALPSSLAARSAALRPGGGSASARPAPGRGRINRIGRNRRKIKTAQ